MAARLQLKFVLVGPDCDFGGLEVLSNCSHHVVTRPASLPRSLRHSWYDNVLFPHAMRRLQADLVFSAYHDVRLPVGVPSAMMIHDTCLVDLPGGGYPWCVRAYYQAMLRVNLKQARHVLTVSEASRTRIPAHDGLDARDVGAALMNAGIFRKIQKVAA